MVTFGHRKGFHTMTTRRVARFPLQIEEQEDRPLSFARPDVTTKDDRGRLDVDKEASEAAMMFGALGRPDVYYLGKRNKYYKNANCTKEFSDEEIQALKMPIPAEIENERRRIRKQCAEEGKHISELDLINMTAPKPMENPPEVLAVLPPNQGLARDIAKLKAIAKKQGYFKG